MPGILHGKNVVLGISGGIAAYKMVEVARELTKSGAHVDVMLTKSALSFVTPLTFQTLTRRPVHTDVFEPWTESYRGHISYGLEADAMLVAPATANVIAKLAHGLADDMLTVTALALRAPLIVAPAMDHDMYRHPATQENLQTLRRRGVRIVGPDQGPLASGLIGDGRLVSPERLIGAVRRVLAARGPLAGKRVVVTAGPTREPVDPIRYLSNRSSGKMGYALAEAALDAGADVTLITGPTGLERPPEAEVVEVESAAEMLDAVRHQVPGAHALIMAAAVADYRPATVASEKIKKTGEDLFLRLTRTVDILASLDVPGLVKVGFAAETGNLVDYARQKLIDKRLDLIVANEATSVMGSDEARVLLIRTGADPEPIGPKTKAEVAEAIIARVVALMAERQTIEGKN